MDKKAFGQSLMDWRQAADLTVAEVAEITGVTAKTVKQWEGGQVQPGIETATKLAAAYGITASAVFAAITGDDPRPDPAPAMPPQPDPAPGPADPLDDLRDLLYEAGADVTAADDAARGLDRATRKQIATLADEYGWTDEVTATTREAVTPWILVAAVYGDEWTGATAHGLESAAQWAVKQYEQKIGDVDGDGDIDLDDLKAATGKVGPLVVAGGLGLLVGGPAGAAVLALFTGVAEALFSDDRKDAEQIKTARIKLAPVLAALARLDARAPAGMLTGDPDAEEWPSEPRGSPQGAVRVFRGSEPPNPLRDPVRRTAGRPVRAHRGRDQAF